MLRLAAVAVLLLACSGCMRMYRSAAGVEDPDAAEVRQAAGVVLSCLTENMSAKEDRVYGDQGFKWSASGCSRGAACRQLGRRQGGGWECLPLPLPFWLGTEDEVPVGLAVERLELETNCPAKSINAVRGTAALATRSSERAYRMNACGNAFVCSVRLPAAVECKAALADVAAE